MKNKNKNKNKMGGLLPTTTNRGPLSSRRISHSGNNRDCKLSTGLARHRPHNSLGRFRCQRQQRFVVLSSILLFSFTFWLLLYTPRYELVNEISFAVKDLNELAYGTVIRPAYYNLVEVFDTCTAVGMQEVEIVDKGTEVMEGEGQSWNHIDQSSGDACAYRLTRGDQLPVLMAGGDEGGRGTLGAAGGLGLPKIFIFEPEVNAYAREESRCEEQFFTEALRSNVTGTLVSEVWQADRIYVSFLAQCFPNGDMDKEKLLRDRRENRNHFTKDMPRRRLAKATPLNLLWEEVRHADEVRNRLEDTFIYSERHWTKRTGFATPIRDVLRDFPFTILSPEVTNLQVREAKSADNLEWLSKHIVMPQPPLVAWPLEGAVSPEGRPHKFCFSGTQINNERRILSDALEKRNDSSVVAGCRRDRKSLQHHLRNNKYSASQQYRKCEMCLVPHGDSLSDRRLFDAMASGCVPVVTPIMRPLPFAMTEEVDYKSAALFLKEPKTLNDLEEQLNKIKNAMSPEKLAMYRENSVRIAQKLSFSECGGQAGLVLTLKQLQIQREEREKGIPPRDLTSVLLYFDNSVL
ncbi:exostosin domain-containing protein [Chloropicon primus]|uniref:Exostosin GT47 domain-containing protein n=1 Tax=Chloropicon primus TaxID=1764295 RepID=A0A5B8MUA9_9CHLO|nr:hypothetical protein A3770_11p64750 [Chloropicon primus]UPR03167.1 exostosin domain-containing protein [Chloropicon primus]|eukprot:QDZ23957.1 hypothetical protein A3770_11p64750 [Chloropicon primus]